MKSKKPKVPFSFHGGSVVKNPPANGGDLSSIPGSGRSHMPWSVQAGAPQLWSRGGTTTEPKSPTAGAPQAREAIAEKGLHSNADPVQQWRSPISCHLRHTVRIRLRNQSLVSICYDLSGHQLPSFLCKGRTTEDRHRGNSGPSTPQAWGVLSLTTSQPLHQNTACALRERTLLFGMHRRGVIKSN